MTTGEQFDVVFPDLFGLTHGKTVPNHRLDYPTHYAVTCMVQGLDLEFLEIDLYSTGAGFPDMEARVDLETTRPWLSGRSIAMASLFQSNGDPLPMDSRRQLRLICEEFEELGYTPMAGFEMEFFLLERRQPMTRLAVPDHRVYGIGDGADPSGTLEAIVALAEHADLQVEGMNAEFAPAQVEVSLHYQNALASADCALLFRELTRLVARTRGIDASYMARPFGDTVGSGLHANLSMARADGSNAFDEPGDELGISDLARHFIAGLLVHHEAITAFAAPTVNSYKRLTPGMLSGYWANWGIDNRLSTVRVPGQRGATTRVEHRMADGTASPHLLLSALAARAAGGRC
ncbi:MAG: glutamine synthetase family protein [Actinobacteria bacterium]|nr:glutamine synthetase family protein [Actinomycetota bacterium]